METRGVITRPICEYGRACTNVRTFFFNIKFETKGHHRQMIQYQTRSWHQSYNGYPHIAPQSGVCRAHPQLPNLRDIYIYIYIRCKNIYICKTFHIPYICYKDIFSRLLMEKSSTTHEVQKCGFISVIKPFRSH